MSQKISVPPKKELNEFYNFVKSISKTAKKYKTSNPTVKKWLELYGIEKYTQQEANTQDHTLKKVEIPSKEDLIFLYQNLSIADIRKIYNIGQETFYEWLSVYEIDRVSLGTKITQIKKNNFHKRFSLSKEQIESDYKEVGCMGTLSIKYKCSMSTIKKLFKLYKIDAIFPKSSKGQNEIIEFITSLGITNIVKNDRKVLFPLELDIYIPSHNLAIEYCGVYFHSQTFGNKSKNYHRDKHVKCKEKGIKLITVFDSEWTTKKEIVKSIIANKLGKTSVKIPARKTDLRIIDYKQISKFEKENHLQGTRPGKYYYGLFYKNELVMSISLGIPRFNKKYNLELIRMTTKMNTIVVGGMSKIFSNINHSNIITYADNRYGDGQSYEKLGFIKQKDSSPNYFYFSKKDTSKLYSRNKFQKHRIPNAIKEKSEYENMLIQGYDRIWDCGNSIYVL